MKKNEDFCHFFVWSDLWCPFGVVILQRQTKKGAKLWKKV